MSLSAFTMIAISAPSLALTSEQVYKEGVKSVVVIRTESGLGSGVLITDLLVATNCHVTRGSDKVVVEYFKTSVGGTVVGRNELHDVCAIRLDHPLQGSRPVGGVRRWQSVNVGEPVYALGAPSGFTYSLSGGLVSQKREHKGGQLVQFEASISPGNSGGGLFDANAKLIGLPSFSIAGMAYVQNLNFAWSIDVFPEPLWSAMRLPADHAMPPQEAAKTGGPKPGTLSLDVGLRQAATAGDLAQGWREAFARGNRHESLELAASWTRASPDKADAWVARGRSADRIKPGSGFPFFKRALECNHSHQDAMYYGALSAREAGNSHDFRRLSGLLRQANPRRAEELEANTHSR